MSVQARICNILDSDETEPIILRKIQQNHYHYLYFDNYRHQ